MYDDHVSLVETIHQAELKELARAHQAALKERARAQEAARWYKALGPHQKAPVRRPLRGASWVLPLVLTLLVLCVGVSLVTLGAVS